MRTPTQNLEVAVHAVQQARRGADPVALKLALVRYTMALAYCFVDEGCDLNDAIAAASRLAVAEIAAP